VASKQARVRQRRRRRNMDDQDTRGRQLVVVIEFPQLLKILE
jgi:hypothetical protein